MPEFCTIVLARAAGSEGEVDVVDTVASNCVISSRDGEVAFSLDSCGHIVQSGGITVKAKRLASIMAEATVLKIDIEGQEFRVIPEQLDDMSEARAWIVEIHPGVGGDPADVTRAFRDRGYDLWWNAPTSGEFEPYADEPWTARTTLIARR